MLDKSLLAYIKDKKKYIFYIVISNCIGLVLSVSTTALLIYSIYNFINGHSNYGILSLLDTIGTALVKVITVWLSQKFSNKLADYVVLKLREDTYSKFLRLDSKTPFTSNEMAQLSTEGIEQLRLYYSSYLPSFFYAMIAPMMLFVLFMFIDIPVAVLYLVCVPLIPMSIIMVSKWAKKIFNKYWDKYTSLGDSFLDNTKGMKELKIFKYDDKRQLEMMKESEDFRKITMKVLTMQLFSVTIMDLVAFGGAGVGIVLSLIAMKNGLDVYITLFMVLVGAEFFLPMRALGSAFHVAMNGATAGKKIMKLLDIEEKEDGKIILDKVDSVSFTDVSFNYDDKMVLSNIYVNLDKGLYSLVGVSGSGKSTIAKLLSRVIDPSCGTIKLNDVSSLEYSKSSFYDKVAYVSNNTYIFHQSIRKSFLFYNPNLSEEDMINILKQVKLSYLDPDYEILEGSSNLSGGEHQRLSLAFYLAKEYDLYIFDEITSNIDIESEEIILDIINDIAKEKIVLMISHRLRSTINSKCIYYLQNGKIVLSGSFDQLISYKNSFKDLYEYQMSLEELR